MNCKQLKYKHTVVDTEAPNMLIYELSIGIPFISSL